MVFLSPGKDLKKNGIYIIIFKTLFSYRPPPSAYMLADVIKDFFLGGGVLSIKFDEKGNKQSLKT